MIMAMLNRIIFLLRILLPQEVESYKNLKAAAYVTIVVFLLGHCHWF